VLSYSVNAKFLARILQVLEVKMKKTETVDSSPVVLDSDSDLVDSLRVISRGHELQDFFYFACRSPLGFRTKLTARYEHVYSPNKAVRQTERQIIYNRF